MDLAAILQRRKSQLTRAEIVETDREGRKWKVERDADGREIRRTKMEGVTAPLIEAAPDPAVVKILEGLYLGSQDAAANFEGLMAEGVTHILNVATGIANFYPSQFTYKSVPILDLDETNIRTEFAECFSFIEEARRSGGVLVHCNAGVSRSATVVVAFVMREKQLGFDEALALVKQRRPSVRPNPGFEKQLRAYEKELALEDARG